MVVLTSIYQQYLGRARYSLSSLQRHGIHDYSVVNIGSPGVTVLGASSLEGEQSQLHRSKAQCWDATAVDPKWLWHFTKGLKHVEPVNQYGLGDWLLHVARALVFV